MECLALACNNDWDKAWSLREPDDFTLKVVSYESRTHTFNRSGHFKDGMARLYFVKLNPTV